ncbi:Translation factor pelota [Entomophthora muscae]|uniref:Translation factor pelota n=1 Tax=Entomophthora muscae TaxID=34485 RepID=A0ACC2TXP9_9FUNG|nr:Translation factor pelota [Entomophthora muscae]
MKLVSKRIERDRSGFVKLICEEAEDVWHVYNLISKGDQLKSSTERRIRLDGATGSADSTRLKLTITISITDIVFDPTTCSLRVNGKNITESKHIKLGAFHTVDVVLNQTFTLLKEEWDSINLDRIDDACDVTKQADVGAIVLQEGLSNICLLTKHMTVVRQRIETPIPRKRRGSVTNYEKGLQRFFDQIYQSMLRHFNFEILKVIIIAGPGFIKDQLFTYIFDQATVRQYFE